MPPATTQPILGDDGAFFRLLNAINPAIPSKYRMMMIGSLQGMKPKEIAEACNCDPRTVSNAMGRADIQAEMTRLLAIRSATVLDRTSELRTRYEEVAKEMLEVQIDLARTAEEEKTRAMCARDVLAGAHGVMGIGLATATSVPKLTIRTVVVNQTEGTGAAHTHIETEVVPNDANGRQDEAKRA